MSKFTLDEDNNRVFIEGVYFLYTRLKSPDREYKNYNTGIVVDKPTKKLIEKKFNKRKAKEVDTDEFSSVFGFEPPFEGEEQFIFNFGTNAFMQGDGPKLKKGDPIPYFMRPKAFVPSENGKVRDITRDVNIGNGSFGDISLSITKTGGAQLEGILVKELLEYTPKSGSTSVFGEVENPQDDEPHKDDTPPDDTEDNTQYPDESPDLDSDDDDDIPF
jgi:hypothetical protein